MIKVFLVEDEFVIRKAIKHTINWEQEGFELVGEAGDGEVAYPKILSTKPDILLTDIRMPFMDGLELSRLVKESLPDIRILIISGYDDFEYAKQAISIGVEEYLMKPITEETLLKELNKAADSIRDENMAKLARETYKKERQEIRALELQKFFRDMLDGRVNVQDSLEQGRELGIDIIAPWYNILLLQIFPKDLEYGLLESYSKAREELNAAVRKKIENMPCVYLYEQPGGILCFIEMADSMEALQSQESQSIEELRAYMEDHMDVKYFLAIGKPVERIRDMDQSYNAASRRFAERYLSDDSKVFYAQNGSERPEGEKSHLEKKISIDYHKLNIGKIEQKYMMNFLRNGSVTEIQGFVADYFDSIDEESLLSLPLRQYIIMGAVICAISFLGSINVPQEEIDARMNDFQNALSSVGSIEEARDYMERLLTEAISVRNKVADKRYTRVIDEARVYIQENYNNEDISLHSVASNVNVSPNHFSMVFKQETGETFIEYLTKIRMEKARELLLCTSMKTSEVGFEVGYRDPHYFSYIFKKTQGLSPKEYRKTQRDQDKEQKQ